VRLSRANKMIEYLLSKI
jgi:CRP-like cAMP-binding protein